MRVDVLSDVLRAVRLTGAVFFDVELSAPWVIEAPPSQAIADLVMPGAERVIECHLVARGACWGHVVGEAPRRLREGDLIVFPQGDAHVLSSAPGMRATPDMQAYARRSTPLPMVYERGGGGEERARIMCCFLGCDERPFNPLLSALPAVIHLASGADGITAGWLAALLRAAVRESSGTRPGGENVLARVSELIFVEAIRQYVDTLPAAHADWLSGLRDPLVGEALAALHRQPAEMWTVARLARHVGVSRSVLAERFTVTAGLPPMQYLALWRMQLASRLLLDDAPIAAVATAVGYESEAAFSRAFKKLVGQAPTLWRRHVHGYGRQPTTGEVNEQNSCASDGTWVPDFRAGAQRRTRSRGHAADRRALAGSAVR